VDKPTESTDEPATDESADKDKETDKVCKYFFSRNWNKNKL